MLPTQQFCPSFSEKNYNFHSPPNAPDTRGEEDTRIRYKDWRDGGPLRAGHSPVLALDPANKTPTWKLTLQTKIWTYIAPNLLARIQTHGQLFDKCKFSPLLLSHFLALSSIYFSVVLSISTIVSELCLREHQGLQKLSLFSSFYPPHPWWHFIATNLYW